MGNFENALLLIMGIAIGAVVVFVVMRSKAQLASPYVVRNQSNIEEWQIIKDSEGSVKGVRVVRSAEER